MHVIGPRTRDIRQCIYVLGTSIGLTFPMWVATRPLHLSPRVINIFVLRDTTFLKPFPFSTKLNIRQFFFKEICKLRKRFQSIKILGAHVV